MSVKRVLKSSLALIVIVLAFLSLIRFGNFDLSTSLKRLLNETDASEQSAVSLEELPPYSGSPYVVLNQNVPNFTEEELNREPYESYSELDYLNRVGVAQALIGEELMPENKRGSISEIKPTGWEQREYDFINGKSLYNRCHLIAYQLTGEGKNEKNLMTGTRYFNVQAMLPFESEIADYIRETNNHVLYRVTPIFEGDNLLANGAVLEAMSVEDRGASVCFNVFCYNVEPGVTIDYKTGENTLSTQPG